MTDLIDEFDNAEKTDSFKVHNEFIKKLVSEDNYYAYELHEKFLETKNETLHERLCRGFSKRSQKAGGFLLEKLLNKKLSSDLFADYIQILGLMKYYDILKYIPTFLKIDDELIKYKCIIVLGWLGSKNEINVLGNILSSHEVGYLRGFSATAMRQIWFRHSDLEELIVNTLYKNLISENDDLINAMIIVSLQDILKEHFGLKEKSNGEILGDIKKSKSLLLSKNIISN